MKSTRNTPTTNTTAGRSLYGKGKVPVRQSEGDERLKTDRKKDYAKAKMLFTRRLGLTHAVCVVANCEKKGEKEEKKENEEKTIMETMAFTLAS